MRNYKYQSIFALSFLKIHSNDELSIVGPDQRVKNIIIFMV